MSHPDDHSDHNLTITVAMLRHILQSCELSMNERDTLADAVTVLWEIERRQQPDHQEQRQ